MVDSAGATLLGSPISDESAISNALREKIKLLWSMEGQLKYLSSHDGLLLLRHSLAIPKLLYSLRFSPCFLAPVLQEYYQVLKSCVSAITNFHFVRMIWLGPRPHSP